MAEGINKCEYHALHDDTLKRHDHEIRDIKVDVNALKITSAEVNTKFVSFMESMSRLPQILDELKESNIETKHEIKDIKSDLKEIKESQDARDKKIDAKIDVIDNESKVNTRTWVRDNFGKLVVIVAVGTIVLTGIATFIITMIINNIK